MPALGELYLALGFDVDDAKLKDFNQSLKSTLNTMLEIAGVSLSIAGFARLMEGASQTAAQFREMSKELGIGTDGMQKFALAANQVNPTKGVEAFRQSYENFARTLLTSTEIYGTGSQPGALALLTGRGVSRGESPDSVLAAIRKNIPNLEKTQSPAFISDLLDKIGIGASSRQYFNLSDDQIEARTKELLMTKSAADQLSHLADVTAVLSQQFTALGYKFGGATAGGTSEVVQGISALMGALISGDASHLTFDTGKFKGILGDVFGGQLEVVKSVGTGIGNLISPTVQKIFGDPKKVQSYFESKGWNAQNAHIIEQGLYSESGLDPNIYGHGKEAKGLAGEAYGIGQWHKARQEQFKKLYGYDIHGSSLEAQSAFVEWELTHTHARAALEVMAAKSDNDKFAAFKGNYEGAKGFSQTNNFNIHGDDPKVIAKEVEAILAHQHLDAQANLLNQ